MPHTLLAWIESADAQLPMERTHPDFLSFLSGILDRYSHAMQGLGPGQLEDRVRSCLPQATRLVSAVKEAARLALHGSRARAYHALEGGLKLVEPQIGVLFSQLKGDSIPHYYRMRISDSPKMFVRSDLFHIPFEKVGLVGSKRFSIEGLPCLYLGQSVYVCWEEMKRPSFASVYVSQLRVRDGQELRVLDLAYVPRFQAQFVNLWAQHGPNEARLEELIAALVVLWPLQAACSIRAREPEASFKPEYIIPQLLLEWVAEESSWHAIRYFSTRVRRPTEPQLGANLVLPARILCPNGHCEVLRGLLEMTEVWNWETAFACALKSCGPVMTGEIEAAEDAFVEYSSTRFAALEMILNARDAAPL